MQITSEMVSGKTEKHLKPLNARCLLHESVIPAFMALQTAAAEQGFDLQVASGFRSYDRQLAIWNAKALGERPVFDQDGHPIDLSNLSEREQVLAILRWSALPGCSRHHWGTDMDIWDAAAVSDDYQLQLSPEEYEEGGPFYPLSCWLNDQMSPDGFWRPYQTDNNGVAPEPWHLSYRPVAGDFEKYLDKPFIRRIVDNNDLQLRRAVLDNLDEIMPRFIQPQMNE